MPNRTLADLAELCGATLQGDGARSVSGPADLASAGPDEISFLANERYAPLVETTRAAAVVVGEGVEVAREDLALLRVADPNSAFTKIVAAFAEPPAGPEPGIHPSAVLHPSVLLGEGVSIGALCTLAEGVEVGAGAVLHPGVHVGPRASIGARSTLHPGVCLYERVSVGSDCILHAGVVVGSDGFGFEPTAAGWDKIPQCGTVVIEDGVEIGANCTIDRARFGATRLRRGTKLDNLVQVAHNVEVGEASLLCAQVGVAGSTRVGRRVVLGGQVGTAGHIVIGDGAQAGGQAGITGNVEPGAKITGTPARALTQVLKDHARVRRLAQLERRVRELEARLSSSAAQGGEQ